MLFVAGGARSAEPVVLRGATMGTTYHIKLVTQAAGIDRESLHAEVEQALADIDQQMSTYRPDSELSRFNRSAAGDWFPVSRATAEVVAAAQEISEKTGGAMDATVGPLVRLWRFGPTTGEKTQYEGQFVPPSADDVAAAKQRVGYKKLHVRLDPPALRKATDGLEVDLSSIAPGYAIDRLAQLIADRGILNYMVEIGGEVRASGVRDDGNAWRVAVERPASGGRTMQSAVALENAAIATAGDYRKFFEYEGRRYSHIIDPASGRPVTHSLASVTVVAKTCMEADGWDTPLLVMGTDGGFACAEENDIAAMFIWRRGKDLEIRTTSRWRLEIAR